MKMRNFVRALAIVSSGIASLMAHGESKAEPTKKHKKTGHRSVARMSREQSAGDPPVAGRPLGSGASASSTPAPSKRTALVTVGADSGYQASKPAPRLDPALMAQAEQSTPNLPNNTAGGLSVPFDQVPLSNGSIAPEQQTTRYPWKRQIVTTTFWVGENAAKNNPVPNHASSWDPRWAQNYGGTDTPDPDKRADFMPVDFVPRQNPFYVALPYNDVTKGQHKPEASVVIPWFHKEFKEAGRSVCKGRWIAIQYKGRTCYAQWEDVGPFRTDHWQYVFGNERPKPNLNRGAGLDVSPAVRDYLGMNSTDVTDWRFVDFDEVPSGPWATHGDNNTFVQRARAAQEQVAMRTTSSVVR